MDLKELREKSGLSVERVAVEMGKAVSTIRFWEAGTYAPSLTPMETLKLVNLYQCSLQELAESFLATQGKKGDR
jgi:DNA-binding transcriptional regulator YiaG